MNHNYLKGCLTKHEEQIDLDKSECSEYTFKSELFVTLKRPQYDFFQFCELENLAKFSLVKEKLVKLTITKKFQNFPKSF
jgi:hypothetical protein